MSSSTHAPAGPQRWSISHSLLSVQPVGPVVLSLELVSTVVSGSVSVVSVVDIVVVDIVVVDIVPLLVLGSVSVALAEPSGGRQSPASQVPCPAPYLQSSSVAHGTSSPSSSARLQPMLANASPSAVLRNIAEDRLSKFMVEKSRFDQRLRSGQSATGRRAKARSSVRTQSSSRCACPCPR